MQTNFLREQVVNIAPGVGKATLSLYKGIWWRTDGPKPGEKTP